MLFLPYQINISFLVSLHNQFNFPFIGAQCENWYFLANNVQPSRDDIFPLQISCKECGIFWRFAKAQRVRGDSQNRVSTFFSRNESQLWEIPVKWRGSGSGNQGLPGNIPSFRWRTSARDIEQWRRDTRKRATQRRRLACRLLSMATPQHSW